MFLLFFLNTSLIIKAKVLSGKYSNETRVAQEKRKLFLRYVKNIVKEIDLAYAHVIRFIIFRQDNYFT